MNLVTTEGMTTSGLARQIGLPRQTVHRLCVTMVKEGFLTADDRGGRFRPGRRARTMASTILHASTTPIARRRVLEELAAETGETINFVVPEEQGMSYKDRVETNWLFRIQLPIGTHVPFHATASGKVYLASLRRAERTRLANVMRLEALTPNTITEPDDLLDELKRISRQGFAIDNEEFVEGMVATAVPVTDPGGRYVASLACHGPMQRITPETARDLAPILHRGAERIREALF